MFLRADVIVMLVILPGVFVALVSLFCYVLLLFLVWFFCCAGDFCLMFCCAGVFLLFSAGDLFVVLMLFFIFVW